MVIRNGRIGSHSVVATFNQEKALVGAFSVIMKIDCETDRMDRLQL